ncbi:FixH family protein [Lacinutrix sp. MedPE-SW]|uniref:FixH family protein n=1 Tax=Lacinutrix sp. MedPE-SW TaxID=1860087 RepID=UPI00091D6DCD|nr:FixH family protein [Lacinutrix sp. MedPE-SW]OIQ24153.1 MAG: cytochrome C oxidase Cbb3 [Lacinutrix sp. MedPE-SW]
MKWNWGTGIVVGMLAFMSFILYLVITMSTNEKYSHDLVTEEYYEKEMLYQREIDAETNTYNLKEKIKNTKTNNGWLLEFPKELEPSKIKGKVFLYRPSNEKLDFNMPLNLTSSNLLIPDNKMLDGRWNITIDWEYDGTKYMYKKQILY